MGKERFITSLLVIGLGLVGLPAGESFAQETRADSLEARIEALEARIDSLLALLAQGEGTADAEAELEALRAAAREAAGGKQPDTAEAQGSRTRNLQTLNPEISVTGDIVGSFTAPGGGDNNFSATPREFEFSFQAALDPFARTKIFVTHHEDFEIAGFPELHHGGEEGAGEEGAGEEGHAEEEGLAGGFEIEEGYAYWVGLPFSFGAKLGKFRQEIGLYNRWHTHALLEVNRPLASLVFLGEDGLIQTGGSLTLPTVSAGPSTQTITFEVTRGDNDALFEGGNEMSFLGHLQSFWDVSASSYFQAGVTGVYGENEDASLETRLLGIDLAYRWTPPGRALYRDFALKGEWYFVEREEGMETLSASGGYAQANYRLNRRWIIGARADYLNSFGDEPDIVQLVPSLSWWQSEWVRLRLQYNYVKPDGGDDNHTILLQTVWAIGPHKHESY